MFFKSVPHAFLIQFFALALAALSCNNSFAQQVNVEADSLQLHLNQYNKEKDAIERAIRLGECDDERNTAKKAFEAELRHLDSLLLIIPLNELQAACKSNKFLIVGKWKESSTCVKIRYEQRKYLKGCEIPFLTDSINWALYAEISKAIADKRLCLESVQFSNYTQVEKMPEATNSAQSAQQLLVQIERVLNVYSDKIGINYLQYLAFESKVNVDSTEKALEARTKFLSKCLQKIKE